MKRERYKQSISVFLLIIRDNQLLLIKRDNTGWMDGFYSLPAGALDEGETAKEAIVREVLEEVNATVAPSDIELVLTEHNKTEGNEWLGLYFKTTKWTGNLKVNEPEKHSEIKWVDINILPSNTIPYVEKAIQSYLSNERYCEYGWRD